MFLTIADLVLDWHSLDILCHDPDTIQDRVYQERAGNAANSWQQENFLKKSGKSSDKS